DRVGDGGPVGRRHRRGGGGGRGRDRRRGRRRLIEWNRGALPGRPRTRKEAQGAPRFRPRTGGVSRNPGRAAGPPARGFRDWLRLTMASSAGYTFSSGQAVDRPASF